MRALTGGTSVLGVGLGRFLNRELIGFAGGVDLFRYGGNNPVTFIGHTGLRPNESSGWIYDPLSGQEIPTPVRTNPSNRMAS